MNNSINFGQKPLSNLKTSQTKANPKESSPEKVEDAKYQVQAEMLAQPSSEKLQQSGQDQLALINKAQF